MLKYHLTAAIVALAATFNTQAAAATVDIKYIVGIGENQFLSTLQIPIDADSTSSFTFSGATLTFVDDNEIEREVLASPRAGVQGSPASLRLNISNPGFPPSSQDPYSSTATFRLFDLSGTEVAAQNDKDVSFNSRGSFGSVAMEISEGLAFSRVEILLSPPLLQIGMNSLGQFLPPPTLQLQLDAVDVRDVPAVVPLPAAGWLLLVSLGGLAAMRRRAQGNAPV